VSATVIPIKRTEAPSERDSTRPAASPPVSELSGWGSYPVVEGRQLVSEDFERITQRAALSRGLGRSYGDASLPASVDDTVANSRLANRILAFDPSSGVMRAEAGLSLIELNQFAWRRNWTVPVSPGTQFVTLGGMVAADVHGKNHHVAGSFGDHVTRLRMRVANGDLVECSPDKEEELFWATVGGMGLTGHILEVEFRLKKIPSPWIWRESERVGNLEDLIARVKEAGETWPYIVCWQDLLRGGKDLGRGIIDKGRWAEPGEAPAKPPARLSTIPVPFMLPSWFLQPWMVRLFNWGRYQLHGSGVHRGIVSPISFFYPLDAILEWNRVYGRRGFTQYQCVIPLDESDPLRPRRFLELLQQLGGACYLCVMKDCGPEGKGMLSFLMPGIFFAIDLPVDSRTQYIVDKLNERLIEYGGRIYLAKDAFTRAEHFRAMEPRLDRWLEVRRKWDPAGRLRSVQSVRLFGDVV
jgi:FAD/FMN-containing dehydrogenase